jgi:hypothetical protein
VNRPLVIGMVAAALALRARAGACDPATPATPDTMAVADSVSLGSPSLSAPSAPARPHGLEALAPDMAAHPYRLDPGPRPFLHRFAFSPGFGDLGSERFFVARLAYHPTEWLGYEWSLGHNPAQATHAVLHTIGAQLRHPFPGRLQPYVSASYGMMMVYPGPSLNASPVTKNALVAGAGLEFYIRSDLALRADIGAATVFGRQRDRDGVVTYNYGQQTLGLAFYRTLAP